MQIRRYHEGNVDNYNMLEMQLSNIMFMQQACIGNAKQAATIWLSAGNIGMFELPSFADHVSDHVARLLRRQG